MRLARPLFVAACGLLIATSFPAWASPDSEAFRAAEEPSGVFAPDQSEVRYRAVDVDVATLRTEPDSEPRAVIFSLFPDITCSGIIEQTRIDRPDRWVSRGSLTGQNPGEFTIIVNGPTAAGLITLDRGRRFFFNWHDEAGTHILREIDSSAFEDCGNSHEDDVALPEEPRRAPGGSTQAGGGDDGSLLDVLVVYTPAARSAVGGTVAMNNLITMAIEAGNTAFDLSGITLPRFRLVDTAEIAYSETGDSSTDLARLRDTNDGFMDEVHPLRDDVAADFVSLIVNDFEVCGRAYRMTSLTTAFASSAFSVVDKDCAVGNLSFTHELGHNQGLGHQWSSNGGIFDYSFGYTFVGNTSQTWRTIMAIGSGFRIQRHSNPDVDFDGQPTGIPVGSPQPADGARSIDDTATTVANFRQSGPLNNLCDNAPSIINGSFGFSNINATTDGPAEGGECSSLTGDIWFNYFATCSGVATASVCDADFNTRLVVYEVECPSAPDEPLACDSDACGQQSEVTFAVQQNTFYAVRIGGFAGAEGSGTLVVSCMNEPTPCPQDLANADSAVDFDDLAAFLGFWGPCPAPCAADFDDDGDVDFDDLAILLGVWGPCPA